MITEDLVLPTDGSWLVIPLTGTATVINNSGQYTFFLRLGGLSTSRGFMLEPNTTIIVDETVYITAGNMSNSNPTIGVTR